MCNINSFSFLTASGTYAYIETSFPRNYNDTARLISALIPKNSRPGTCISFWYHMYGPDINTLSVYTKSGGSLGSPIWKRTGSQGNKWKYAQVFVRSLLDYQVGFAQRFCQFCSPSSFFFQRNFKRDVSYEAKGPSTHTNSEFFRGSYNLQKVLSFSGRLEKSLNQVKVIEKYLISLVGREITTLFTPQDFLLNQITLPRKIQLIIGVRTL